MLKPIGSKRGSLTVKDCFKDSNGISGNLEWLYSLVCDCGKEFDITAREWTKEITDCGCGICVSDYFKISVSVKMTFELYQAMAKYAVRNKMTKSEATAKLTQLGLELSKAEE